MTLIYMLGNFQIGPESHSTGDVVDTSEHEALDAIKWGSARLATPEEVRTTKSPLPAAEIRKILAEGAPISKAVPGGRRPHRG